MRTNFTRAACFAALFLFGCATNTIDIGRIAAVTREVARIGTSEAIRDHPEWRPGFQLARDQLNNLATLDAVTLDALLAIISALPVNELSSDTARLSFEGARLLLVTTGWNDVVLVRTEQLKPVVVALSQGITAGLGQEAAMTVRPSMKHYKVR